MATRSITLKLSEPLASRLEASNLISDLPQLEIFLAQAIQQYEAIQTIQSTFMALDADPERFSMEDIQAEIDAYRAEKRSNS